MRQFCIIFSSKLSYICSFLKDNVVKTLIIFREIVLYVLYKYQVRLYKILGPIIKSEKKKHFVFFVATINNRLYFLDRVEVTWQLVGGCAIIVCALMACYVCKHFSVDFSVAQKSFIVTWIKAWLNKVFCPLKCDDDSWLRGWWADLCKVSLIYLG